MQGPLANNMDQTDEVILTILVGEILNGARDDDYAVASDGVVDALAVKGRALRMQCYGVIGLVERIIVHHCFLHGLTRVSIDDLDI